MDAVFAQPSERADIAKSAGSAAFQGLFLTANLETRLARVGSRASDASDADTTVARKQEEFDLGHINWSKVDASGTPDETLIRAEAMLDRNKRAMRCGPHCSAARPVAFGAKHMHSLAENACWRCQG